MFPITVPLFLYYLKFLVEFLHNQKYFVESNKIWLREILTYT